MKKKLFLVLIILCSIFLVTSCKKDDDKDISPQVYDTKRVILFIGDGMGRNHINVSEAYLEKDFPFTNFPYHGEVITQSLAVSGVTDSAAAATAMSTGVKVANNAIAMNKNEKLKTISEYAKEANLGVGIVTSDTLNGATPAAFSAHAKSRGDTLDILRSQIDSNIDLLIGQSNNIYTQNHTSFTPKGYKYVTSFSDLQNYQGKILGCFEEVGYENHSDTTPTLSKLTAFAIEYFEETYPEGYFIMIEGAHMDKMSHSKNIMEMIKYMNEFSNAIDTAKSMLSLKDNYALIVTADHECGDLQYNGETKEEITKALYHSDSHTKVNVDYYIDWKLKEDRYNDLVEILVKYADVIDNTEIFRVVKALLTI